MKKLLLILLCFPLVFTTCKQEEHNVSGTWINKGKGFESTLILKKLENKKNIYTFYFESWIELYDHFIDDTTRFPGLMNKDFFKIEIKDNKAHYNDDIRGEDGLYHKGEQRCNLYFEFNQNEITVRTEHCYGIYGGFGVSFDGKYIQHIE